MPGFPGGYPIPKDPHLRRWMAFVDGENLTLRAQEIAKTKNINFIEGKYYKKDVFIWFPGVRGTLNPGDTANLSMRLQDHAVRSYYYTSVFGDDNKIAEIKSKIWACGFDPQVFKKARKEEKAKGVDIALTIGMLSHAYMNNYDVALLFSGDGDYTPVVNEVKRLGKAVYICAFSRSGLSEELKIASDSFIDIEPDFEQLVDKNAKQ